jgi:hypothetical protein
LRYGSFHILDLHIRNNIVQMPLDPNLIPRTTIRTSPIQYFMMSTGSCGFASVVHPQMPPTAAASQILALQGHQYFNPFLSYSTYVTDMQFRDEMTNGCGHISSGEKNC